MLLHLCLHLCHYVPLYQSYFAVPVEANMRVPVRLRWHMTINLSEHVLRNVSRFRLRAHTLRVDRAIWTHGAESTTFDKCDMNEGQDEQHVLFKCTCPEVCQLRCKYAPLFQQLGFSLAEPYMCQVTNAEMSKFLSQKNYKPFHFISELMDLVGLALARPVPR